MAHLHVALPSLLLLVAILVFAEADKTFGKRKKDSVNLLVDGGSIITDAGKVISFNEDQSLDIVIDYVKATFAEGCVTSWLAGGGPGQKCVKVVIAPEDGCEVHIPYILAVEGRVLSGEKRRNENYSVNYYYEKKTHKYFKSKPAFSNQKE